MKANGNETQLIRPIAESDKPLLREWIAEDPEHSAKGMTPGFFFEAGTEAICFGDEAGPVLFVRCAKALRVDVQFGTAKGRTARSLLQAMPFVIEQARQSGYVEILFESVSPTLIRFCRRHLGFTPLPNNFSFQL